MPDMTMLVFTALLAYACTHDEVGWWTAEYRQRVILMNAWRIEAQRRCWVGWPS